MGKENRQSWTKAQRLAYIQGLIDSEDYTTDYGPELSAYLGDPEPEVRALALRGLWDHPDPQYLDRICNLAAHDPEEEVRVQAVATLGRYIFEGNIADYEMESEFARALQDELLPEEGFRRVRELLLSLARDDALSVEVRRHAIEALGFLIEPEVEALLADAYESADPHLRLSALFAMGRSGSLRWSDAIQEELRNSDPAIRLEAVRAAGEAYILEALPELMRVARADESRDVRMEALWALGRLGGGDAADLLEDATSDPDPEVREVAFAALDELFFVELLEERAALYMENEDEEGEEAP